MGSFDCDELVKSLRILEAGNLYFSILMKNELCKNLNDSTSTFIALNGNQDIKILKEVYIKEGSFDPSISMLQLVEKLNSCCSILKESYLQDEPIRKSAIRMYEAIKKHSTNNFSQEEYIPILMEQVGDYFEKQTSISLKTENNKEKVIK